MGKTRTAIFEDNYLMWESYSRRGFLGLAGPSIVSHMLTEWRSYADLYSSALKRFGFDVVRIVPARNVREPTQTTHSLGHKVMRLPVGNRDSPASQVLSFTRELLKELNRGRYSLIHSVTLYSKFFVAYAPLVSTFCPVLAQYSGGEPPLGRGLLREATWRTLVHFSGSRCKSILMDESLGPELAFQRWSLKSYYRIPERVFAPFPLVCVDTDLFSPKPKQASRTTIDCPENSIVILCPTFIPKPPVPATGKNPFLLINVLSKLPSPVRSALRLYIAGVGPGMNELTVRIKELGLESVVKLLGLVNHRQLPDYYGASDAVFMPYLCRDLTLGTTVIESFACDRPVIGFRRDARVPQQQSGGFLIDAEPT